MAPPATIRMMAVHSSRSIGCDMSIKIEHTEQDHERVNQDGLPLERPTAAGKQRAEQAHGPIGDSADAQDSENGRGR